MSEQPSTPRRVSIHGGHSGQFCNHADNTLAEVVAAYFRKSFEWVGITEHMPPEDDRFLYPEERQAGLTVKSMTDRFGDYIDECRRLKKLYAGKLDVLVGFETEDTPGALDSAMRLIREYGPDYVVGSVHHIRGIPFDYNADAYRKAADACGGIDRMYLHYFDRQAAMIERLRPQAVGHFDLIRIFDTDYGNRLASPEIWKRIERNLGMIRALDLILDFNVAALRKGASEPYISRPILKRAIQMGIPLVPGDDSHGVETVGRGVDEGIEYLVKAGVKAPWRRPIHASENSGEERTRD